MSRILPLSPDAVSQIQSSKQITSLQGVVLSILENSLDAGSSKIEITVDFRRGGCTIEDNGAGIRSSDFLDGGGLGKSYHTSKHHTSNADDFHGSTGSFLASLAALSLLSITSRDRNHDAQATLTLHQGKVIARQLPESAANEQPLVVSHGTRVTVRDLFGNMPVRVKQRALLAETGIDDEKAWHQLKYGIVALLLAWRSPVSVRLRDTELEKRTLYLSSIHPSISTALTEKNLGNLNGKAASFDLKDRLPVLFQASLAPIESRGNWIPISATAMNLTIRGAICLDPAPTKQCQFISIGIHLCIASFGHHDMYDAVNKTFANSSFGSIDDDSGGEQIEKDRRKHDRRYKTEDYTRKQLQGRKGVDRWPMFVLQIRFRAPSKGLNPESMNDADLQDIVSVLEAAATQWLKAHHFRPRERRSKKYQQLNSLTPGLASKRSSSAEPLLLAASRADVHTPLRRDVVRSVSTSKKRKYVDISGRAHAIGEAPSQASNRGTSAYFNSWSRIKSGRNAFYDDLWTADKPATAPAGQTGSKPSPADKRPNEVFMMQSLEAGQLNSNRHMCKTEPNARIVQETEIKATTELQTSSDDFGSFDEQAAIMAVEGADFALGKLSQSDQNPNDSALPPSPGNDLQDLLVDWVDPVTKQSFKVNARTGVVLPLQIKTTESRASWDGLPTRRPAAMDTSISSTGKPLSLLKRIREHSAQEKGAWLPGFLKDWENPVFARQNEAKIPIASLDGPGIDAAEATGEGCSHDLHATGLAGFGAGSTSKLSKSALKRTKVIRQVDQKFILCRSAALEHDPIDDVLVLVDQHAASERVILESLLSQLCAPVEQSAKGSRFRVRTSHTEKPLRFQISAEEHQLFQKHADHFAHWGIMYTPHEKDESLTASQVRQPKREYTIAVDSLPPTILERCTMVPKLLIELLRSEVWAVNETAKSTKPLVSDSICAEDKEDEHPWLGRIGSCPKGIIDMLNSRACRSAIMFNDELSIAECEELMHELSRCAFPFICAHGRVSMVPLILLGESEQSNIGIEHFGIEIEAQSDFVNEFRRWKVEEENTEH